MPPVRPLIMTPSSHRHWRSFLVCLAVGAMLSACVGSTTSVPGGDTGTTNDEDGFTGPPPDTGPLPDIESPSDTFTGDTNLAPAPGLWRLQTGTESWSTVQARGEPTRNAPTETIRAGFDIEQTGFAFFLTETSVYRLNLNPPQWQPPRARSSLFPSLDGVTVAAAYSDERPSPDDDIVILGRSDDQWQLWRGSYNFDDRSFDGFEASDAESVDWTTDAAPTPGDIRAAWRNNDDPRGWLDRVPSCDEANDAFNGYISWMTPSSLHIRDAFFCPQNFFSDAPGRLLANDQRPPGDAIGAAFQHRDAIFWIEQ